jgi:Arc/MetJ-type ribon-helix-helix transcriptional regulator
MSYFVISSYFLLSCRDGRMNVSLTPELEKLVSEKVRSGLYQTASEVVREALRLLKQRDDEAGGRISGPAWRWRQEASDRGPNQRRNGWREYTGKRQ